jgi:hypothetical protein
MNVCLHPIKERQRHPPHHNEHAQRTSRPDPPRGAQGHVRHRVDHHARGHHDQRPKERLVPQTQPKRYCGPTAVSPQQHSQITNSKMQAGSQSLSTTTKTRPSPSWRHRQSCSTCSSSPTRRTPTASRTSSNATSACSGSSSPTDQWLRTKVSWKPVSHRPRTSERGCSRAVLGRSLNEPLHWQKPYIINNTPEEAPQTNSQQPHRPNQPLLARGPRENPLRHRALQEGDPAHLRRARNPALGQILGRRSP